MKTFTLSTCKSVCLAATASLAVVALVSSAIGTRAPTSGATQTAAVSKTSGRATAGSSGSSSQLTGGGTSPGNPGVRSLAVAPTASHGTIVLAGSGGGTGSGSTAVDHDQVFIEAGSFEMGTHVWINYTGPGTPPVPVDEIPIHQVTLDAFLMDKFEVTNGRYVEYLNAGLTSGSVYVAQDTVLTLSGSLLCKLSPSGITFNGTGFRVTHGRRNHPVVNVSWFGACAFANDLSIRRGLTPCYNEIDWSCDHQANGFRLPTEAEWEYAARANHGYFPFPWQPIGGVPQATQQIHGNQANFLNSGDLYEHSSPGTTPVGYYDGNQVVFPLDSLAPPSGDMSNKFGLYDMAGNVQEWCGDWYSEDYYQNSPIDNPTGHATGLTWPMMQRAIRGGSHEVSGFGAGWADIRVANREFGAPDDCNSATGFRLVSAPSAQIVQVPAGTFDMGRHVGTGPSWEFPVHSVTLGAFYMDETEVSNQMYANFLNSAYGKARTIVTSIGWVSADANQSLILCDTSQSKPTSHINYNSTNPDLLFQVTPGREDHPMANVSWFGACAYANYLSSMYGLTPCYDETTWECDFQANGWRLPTEAEWEYAARGGAYLPYTKYPFGNNIDGSQANFLYSGDPYEGALPPSTPVGYFDGNQTPSGVDMANGFGLYDMSGNVMEWCADWFDANYYANSPSDNPIGPLLGTLRNLRGGNFYQSASALSSADRGGGQPTLRRDTFGFRLISTKCQ